MDPYLKMMWSRDWRRSAEKKRRDNKKVKYFKKIRMNEFSVKVMYFQSGFTYFSWSVYIIVYIFSRMNYIGFSNFLKRFYLFIYLFIHSFIHLFIRDRERQRHRQREKQAPGREPDMGLDPGSPGSHPGLRVPLNRWVTQAALIVTIYWVFTIYHTFWRATYRFKAWKLPY